MLVKAPPSQTVSIEIDWRLLHIDKASIESIVLSFI